ARGDDSRTVRAERRRTESTRVPVECEQLGMAKAIDITPLPTAEIGTRPVEQGQGSGDVVILPLLVGHLDRPAVLEPFELLPLPPGFGARPGLAFACFLRAFARFLRDRPRGFLGIARPFGEGEQSRLAVTSRQGLLLGLLRCVPQPDNAQP